MVGAFSTAITDTYASAEARGKSDRSSLEFVLTVATGDLDRMMADPQHQSIASRLVKEICALNGDVTSFVSPFVVERLLEKYKISRQSAGKLDGAKAKPLVAVRATQARLVPQRRTPVRPRRR